MYLVGGVFNLTIIVIKKWNQQQELQSWTRLFGLNFAPMSLGKVLMHLLSSHNSLEEITINLYMRVF